MWKEPLGLNEAAYHKVLKDVLPHLNSLPHKKFNQYAKRFSKGIGIIPEIDEDITIFFNELVTHVGGKLKTTKKDGTLEPTSFGLLENDVNYHYSMLSEHGFIRYGRESNKEETICFLIWCFMSDYKEIMPAVEGYLFSEKEDELYLGIERFFTKLRKERGMSLSYLFDEHILIRFDQSKWFQSLKLLRLPPNPTKLEIEFAQVTLYMIRKGALTHKGDELNKKLEAYNIPISKKWLTLLSEIYAIRCWEKETNAEILKSDHELQKIWGIPRKTWKDKWKFLSRIDKDM